MIEIVILLIKSICILYFIGYGFSSMILPEKLRKDAFFIIPWLGLVLTTFLSVALTMARIPLSQGKYVIFTVALLLLLYSILSKKILRVFNKDTILISFFTFVTLLIVIFPLLVRVGFPTTISLGNLDPISYVNVSEFLIHNSVISGKEIVAQSDKFASVGDLLYYSYRWGSPLILGFFLDVLGLRAYQIYTILISIFYALTFPLVSLLAKLFFTKKSNLLTLFIFLTFSLNSILLYLLNNAFFAQFIHSGIYVLVFILLYSYISSQEFNKPAFNFYDLLIALSITASASIYPDGLLFLAAPFFIFLILNLFSKDRFKYLITFGKIGLLALLINPLVIGSVLKWNYSVFILSTTAKFIGWEKIRNATPLEMTGLYNLFYYRNIPLIFDFLISIPVTWILYLGYKTIKYKKLILSFFIFLLIPYIYFRFTPNYYAHLKSVSYLLFFFVIIFSLGLVVILNKIKNKFILYAVIAILALFSFRSSYRTIYQMYWHSRVVDKPLISLQELNNNSKISKPFYTADVYLDEYDVWSRLWQEYFLMDKNILNKADLISDKEKDKPKLVLTSKEHVVFGDKKIIYRYIIWENKYYILGEINEELTK